MSLDTAALDLGRRRVAGQALDLGAVADTARTSACAMTLQVTRDLTVLGRVHLDQRAARPSYSSSSFSTAGISARQGTQRGPQKSTSTLP